MFSFKYRPCDYAKMRKVVVDNPTFIRIDSTSAFYGVHHIDANNVRLVLWSYETPIMVVLIENERIPQHPSRDWQKRFTVCVNEDSWNCSPTTKRHVNKFLSRIVAEEDISCTFSRHMIDRALSNCRSHNYDYVECYSPNVYPTCDVTIARCSGFAISNYLESFNAPRPIGEWLKC